MNAASDDADARPEGGHGPSDSGDVAILEMLSAMTTVQVRIIEMRIATSAQAPMELGEALEDMANELLRLSDRISEIRLEELRRQAGRTSH